MKKDSLLIQAFDEPNHTQTPNKFFDMLPSMGDAELRVTLVMIRQTFGFHRDTFKMGVSKLAAAAGLTDNGARNGAKDAEERGIFKRANPDSQKEAEWVLNITPNHVDPQPSEPIPPTTLTHTPNHVDHIVGVKESIKENKEKVFSKSEMQGLTDSANKTVDAMLAMQANAPASNYAGREQFRADLLPYSDWYHKATGQQCRTKAAVADWWKALLAWKDEGLTIEDLQTALDARRKYRTVASPNELTKDAAAIHALPQAQEQYNPDKPREFGLL